MLRATFLGWQSWLLGSEVTRILLDPLLVDEVGRGPRGTRGRYPFWPPRRFDWPVFPTVDAVVITHEHDDHFSIPSLSRIDRRIPVFLSSRASAVARSILEDMGFSVQLLAGGETVQLNDLALSAFCGDQTKELATDEWSTIGILLRHLSGHGNFFTNVDVEVTSEMEEAVRRASRTESNRPCHTLSFEQMTFGLWGSPVTGGRVLHGVPEGSEAAQFALGEEALGTILRGERLRPVAGQTGVLVDGRLVAVEPSTPFLTWVRPPSDWVQKNSFWGEMDAGPQPTSGIAEFSEERLPELEAGLKQLAEHLYGGPLFRRLYSLSATSLGGRRPTFVWCLLADAEGGAYAYEYRPENCAFVPVDLSEDFQNRYVGVVISWATDLMSLFRGEIDPRSIARGYRSAWLPPCEDIAFFSQVLWPFFHPLRHPETCLRQYRATLQDELDAPVCVHPAPVARSLG